VYHAADNEKELKYLFSWLQKERKSNICGLYNK